MGKVTFRVFGFYIAAIFVLWAAGHQARPPVEPVQESRGAPVPLAWPLPDLGFPPDAIVAREELPIAPQPWMKDRLAVGIPHPFEMPVLEIPSTPVREIPSVMFPPAPPGLGDGSGRTIPLADARRGLTPGRREAIRAMFAGQSYLLYIGRPDAPRLPPVSDIGAPRHAASGLRYECMGDLSDPVLEAFVDDFNVEMLYAHKRGLVGNAGAQPIDKLALYLRPELDPLFLERLRGAPDDWPDGWVVHQDGGTVTLSVGSEDGLPNGTRFLVRSADVHRTLLGMVEVTQVYRKSAQARVVERFAKAWPEKMRVTSPFFRQNARVRVRALDSDASLKDILKTIPGIDVVEGEADVYVGRAQPQQRIPGRWTFVYDRLLRWFQPQLRNSR
ncbi:MAG: hypothetical protein AAGD14_13605 [Planctomycetota bacterium]